MGEEASLEAEPLQAVPGDHPSAGPADPLLTRVARVAAGVFDAASAVVAVVDEGDRLRFSGHYGAGVEGVPPGPEQLGEDAGWRGSVFVGGAGAGLDRRLLVGGRPVGFVAAAPLSSPEGRRLGVLWVLDDRAHDVTPRQRESLADVAALAAHHVNAGLATRDREATERNLRRQAASDKEVSDEVVAAFRSALLPLQLPAIPGVDLAARYRPAHASQVGGDFYDVFRLARRTWGITLGDVCGKGPAAGAVSATARHTLRAAALDNEQPAAVLSVLNEALLLEPVQGNAPDNFELPFCTAVCVRLEARRWGYQANIANGGHPLPRVLRRDGSVERVGRAGTLIGVFPQASFPQFRVYLGFGDRLILFTDGLTEATTGTRMLGDDEVDTILSRYGWRNAADIAEFLERTATPAGRRQRDDIAVLALGVARRATRWGHAQDR